MFQKRKEKIAGNLFSTVKIYSTQRQKDKFCETKYLYPFKKWFWKYYSSIFTEALSQRNK